MKARMLVLLMAGVVDIVGLVRLVTTGDLLPAAICMLAAFVMLVLYYYLKDHDARQA